MYLHYLQEVFSNIYAKVTKSIKLIALKCNFIDFVTLVGIRKDSLHIMHKHRNMSEHFPK